MMNGKYRTSDYLPVYLFCLVAVIADCAVCGSPLQNQNLYEELKCRDEKTNRALYVGEVFYRRGQCIRVQCLGNLEIWEDRCQIPRLEGNCSEIPPANEFLDYPKCCPQYSCKLFLKDNGNTEETRIYDQYGNRKSTYITQVFTRRMENGIVAGGPIRTKLKV
ncbi:protein Vago isoform X2 [Episyrphus balteatus]|uniref:protein Vago isoform X2 n=1 Tax=Episyrphus balteatus TaxID=286459 RepID=UPI0024869240|nr:protein Vago isoform X2 [Episyrphus balteatus]